MKSLLLIRPKRLDTPLWENTRFLKTTNVASRGRDQLKVGAVGRPCGSQFSNFSLLGSYPVVQFFKSPFVSSSISTSWVGKPIAERPHPCHFLFFRVGKRPYWSAPIRVIFLTIHLPSSKYHSTLFFFSVFRTNANCGKTLL